MRQKKAESILLSLGFTRLKNEGDSTEWDFVKQGLNFELHHRLLYDDIVNTQLEKNFADSAWKYVLNHELETNYHFVFLLIHIKRHLLKCGVGIRQFVDLAIMSKYADLDKNVIAGLLNQVGLEKFGGICSTLCMKWFDVQLPVENIMISDSFYFYATETILSNGVFGFENPNNREKDLLNSIDKYGRMGSILRKFFPSYISCIGTLKYKWIMGKPYLMPMLWLYRPFEFLITGRFKMGFDRISDVAKSKQAFADRNIKLEEWGLNSISRSL